MKIKWMVWPINIAHRAEMRHHKNAFFHFISFHAIKMLMDQFLLAISKLLSVTYTPAIPARMHAHLSNATSFFALHFKRNKTKLFIEPSFYKNGKNLSRCVTYKNSVNFNWLTMSLPMSTLSSTQKTGNINSGIVRINGTLSIGFTSILNCIRLAARNGVPVIWIKKNIINWFDRFSQ